MELSLWPSGRCTLLWVAFLSQQPQGPTRGGVRAWQRQWEGCGSGGDGRPVGVGTPAASPWSREGRILQGNAAGGDQGRVASSSGGEAEAEVWMSRRHLSGKRRGGK